MVATMLRGVIPLATRRVGGGLGAASRTARLPRFSAWLLVDCALGQKPLARSPVAARFPAYAGLAHLSAIRFNTGGRSEAPGVVRAVPGAVGEWDVEGEEEQLEDVGYKSIPEPKKVFVGNVSWNSTVRELGLHFEEACGEVEDVYMPQDRDGRPKGIAFVTFADPASASKAVKTLHEVEFDGRPLVVEIAQTSERRREPRESSGRVGGQRLFVSSLSYDTTWETLKDFFKQAGNVTYASVSQRPDGTSKGCGVVQFDTTEAAEAAIKMLDGAELDGRTIAVREDRQSQTRKRGPYEGSMSSNNERTRSREYGGRDREFGGRDREFGGRDRGFGGRERRGRDGPNSKTFPGDWTCPECNANVFARKDVCFRCGSPKP